MEEAARIIAGSGVLYVLVKGGHLEGGEVLDLLSDGENVWRLTAGRIAGPSPHGTGCVLSSAIAARLAWGDDTETAVRYGGEVVRRAIRNQARVGRGAPVADPADGTTPQGRLTRTPSPEFSDPNMRP
jgi:hydroxymethylpyrimidine kinase/phosphomethylpyrimidine kinase